MFSYGGVTAGILPALSQHPSLCCPLRLNFQGVRFTVQGLWFGCSGSRCLKLTVRHFGLRPWECGRRYPDENLLLADHGIANHRPRIIIVDVGALVALRQVFHSSCILAVQKKCDHQSCPCSWYLVGVVGARIVVSMRSRCFKNTMFCWSVPRVKT